MLVSVISLNPIISQHMQCVLGRVYRGLGTLCESPICHAAAECPWATESISAEQSFGGHPLSLFHW